MFSFGLGGWGSGSDYSNNSDDNDRMEAFRESQYDLATQHGEEWFEEKKQQGIIIANLRKSTVIGDKMVQMLEEVEKKGTGTFAVTGELKDAPITSIKLKSDGTILKYPLEENEMEMLIPKFEMSPFGRGEKTLVDATVRNSWQMNPAGFETTNKNWNKFISQSVSSQIKEKLGITDSFVAKPYKLLLYKTGSFFKPHRDSEKEEGMFGTLVVQLPSKYTGGELIVRHGGSSKTFDHSTKGGGEEFLHYYSAFYCDCEHEVLPLQSGVRLCLIYNLVLKKRKDESPKELPTPSSKKEGFANILKEWRFNSNEAEDISEEEDEDDEELLFREREDIKDDEPPPHHSPRLIYLLAHQYSKQSLNYENLKGTDKTIANFLLEMAEDSEMIAFLGIMERSIFCNSSSAEWFGNGHRDNGKPIVTIENLRLLAMDKDLLPLLPPTPLECGLEFEEREVIPKSRLQNLKEHDSKIEYTGNEGTEITKQYKSSCILVFPTENLFFHCLQSLDNATAEKMFLVKMQKYKAEKKDEAMKTLLKAFLKRQRRTDNSYEDMEKWLKVFMEMGDKGLLSVFLKSYWVVINSELEVFLSTVFSNRGNPLWDYLFDELNAEMKQQLSSSQSWSNDKTITADEFRSAVEVIKKQELSVISTFLQSYGHLLFVHLNEVLPVIIGTRTGTTIGDEFLRVELMKLFENATPLENTKEINWSSVLDGIISVNDGENNLLCILLSTYSSQIKTDIDKFLPSFLQLRGRFTDQFITTELRKIFSRSPAVKRFRQEVNLTVMFSNLLQLKDASFMGDFISAYVSAINDNSKVCIPAILDMEELFGWKMVSDELKKIIIGIGDKNYDPTTRQLDIVSIVLDKKNGREDVIQSCTEYVKIIFEKCADWKDDTWDFRSRFEKLAELAPKLNLDINEFLQSRNTSSIVKLLQGVADRNKKKLNAVWLKVGASWFERMKSNPTAGDKKLLLQLKKLLTESGHRCNKKQ